MEKNELPKALVTGLGRRAARGAAVTATGQIGRILIQLVSVVILARLLSPNDYGLFAMVMSIAGIAEVFRDFGLSQAMIQAKNVSREQRDSLFWVNSGIGLGLTFIVFGSSWGIAKFYRHEELVELAQGAALVFFINGLATQYRASLSRALRFKALAFIELSSALVGMSVAIFMGFMDFGAWSLIGQLLAQATVFFAFAAISSRWIPRLPKRSTSIRGFMRFGRNMVATQLVGYVGSNADRVIIGSFIGAAPLGLYTRPYQLVMNVANQLRAPITNVAIPILSRLQESPRRYWEFTKIGQTALGYSIVAAFGLAVGASSPLTRILLGEQWLDSAPIMSLLASAAALQTLAYFGYWVYVSKGITGVLFKYNLLSVIIKIGCLLVGVRWGVSGVAAGYLIATAVSWPLSLFWINKSIAGVPIRDLTLNFLRMASLAAAAAGASFVLSTLTQEQGPWVCIIASVCGTIAVYALSILFPAVRRDMQELWVLRHHLARK